MTGEFAVFGGLFFGLASMVHCASMCGGVCGRALILLDPTGERSQTEMLLLLQLGRILVYAVLGALIGATGTLLMPQGAPYTFTVLHWVTALSLIWIGFTTLGVLPELAVVNRTVARISNSAGRIVQPFSHNRVAGPIALGAMWGLSACPVVYAIAFSATVTGSALNGALYMTAFGIGTIPGVLGTGLVVHRLNFVKLNRPTQMLAGTVLAAIGFATIYMPWPEIAAFCGVR